MITMNEKDKNEMLDSILNEKEEYNSFDSVRCVCVICINCGKDDF